MPHTSSPPSGSVPSGRTPPDRTLSGRTIADLRPGESGTIVGLAGGAAGYRQRLLAFGLTPGTPVVMVRVAPMGDPMEVRIRNYSLTLRRGEASIVEIGETV